jgi:hypothetical protein
MIRSDGASNAGQGAGVTGRGAGRRAAGLRTGARIFGLAAALGAGATCTDANESLTIVQAQTPDNACNLSEEASGEARRLEGVLDLGLDRAYGYALYPLVANNLPALAKSGGIEPNRVSITGAEIKIVPPPGLSVTWPTGCEAAFDDSASATILPGELKVISISALRACHAQVIRGLFEAGKLDSSLSEKIKFKVVVRAHGRHGGTSIYSDPFEFPIRTCYGCLQTGFTGDYAQFSYTMSPVKFVACDHLASNPYPGNSCNPAQDIGPILCCAEDAKAEKLSCPGVGRAQTTTP